MAGYASLESLAVRRVLLVVAVVLGVQCVLGAAPRQWTDRSGKFQVEASLVTVKDGKAYLEKGDGTVVPVEIAKLCTADQEYLLSLPDHRAYFQKNPIPGVKAPLAKPKMAVIPTPDDARVGEVRRFPNLGWGVQSLAFSPDGALLVAGKMDEAILVFNVVKGGPVGAYGHLEDLGQVESLAFTPDGKTLLCGGSKGRILDCDVGPKGTLRTANRFAGHSGGVRSIAIGSDGRTVLSGGGEKQVRCWDLTNCREQFAVGGFRGPVKATFLTRSLKQALASDGGVLVLIDVQHGKALQSMALAHSTAQAVAISPDGARVAVCDGSKVRLWETRSGRELPPLSTEEMQWAVQFLPTGRHLLSGERGKVALWEVETQRRVGEFSSAEALYVHCLACSPDGRHFASIPSAAGQALQVFRMPPEVEESAKEPAGSTP